MNNISTQSLIDSIHENISPFIHQTPILSSRLINKISGCELFFKCENFQKVGAFKFRGATNAILNLTEAQKKTGVTTHSSGNHGQAVALAAQQNGIKAKIVMPNTAPQVKINAVKGYGAEVILCPSTLHDRETYMKQIVEQENYVPIHPYDNFHIITGQATVAKEFYAIHSNFDYLLTPIGGGGLISGSILSTQCYAPNTKVIGCEPKGADDAYQSFKAKKRIPANSPKSIADGLLTSLGEKNFEIIVSGVHDIICVNDEQIIEAMKLIWERLKVIIEPSAAVPLAVVLNNKPLFKNTKVGIILSGGNVDLNKLPF